MNEGRDVWSGGTASEKSESLNKSLRTTLNNIHRPQELFPKKKRMTEVERVEKQIAEEFEAIKKRVAEREGLIEKSEDDEGDEVIEKSDFSNGSFATNGSVNAPAEDLAKTDTTAHGEPLRSLEHRRRAKKAWQSRQRKPVAAYKAREREAEQRQHRTETKAPTKGRSFEDRIDAIIRSDHEENPIEKAIKQSGFDKLPMVDSAREMLEDALANGAEPVTQYTGKVLIERGIPEVPPASLAKIDKELEVGDRVIPLRWVPVGPVGAKFDLPYVPPTARITRMYKGPAKVTKDVYSPGRAPKDCNKCESVVEERLWALDLEPEGDAAEKNADNEDVAVPVPVTDTTMVLRLEPLAQPSGDVGSNL
jgi:hypothetical protein